MSPSPSPMPHTQAMFNAVRKALVHDKVTFTGALSYSPDGINSWYWQLGGSALSSPVTHQGYEVTTPALGPGTLTVSLEVTSRGGKKHSTSASVQVVDDKAQVRNVDMPDIILADGYRHLRVGDTILYGSPADNSHIVPGSNSIVRISKGTRSLWFPLRGVGIYRYIDFWSGGQESGGRKFGWLEYPGTGPVTRKVYLDLLANSAMKSPGEVIQSVSVDGQEQGISMVEDRGRNVELSRAAYAKWHDQVQVEVVLSAQEEVEPGTWLLEPGQNSVEADVEVHYCPETTSHITWSRACRVARYAGFEKTSRYYQASDTGDARFRSAPGQSVHQVSGR